MRMLIPDSIQHSQRTCDSSSLTNQVKIATGLPITETSCAVCDSLLPCFCPSALRCFAAPPFATDFTGRVIGVTDGDTITVLHNGKGERIRLHGIDCPEKRQAFGKRAKQFTAQQVTSEP